MYLDDMSLTTEVITESVTIQKEKMISFARDYDPFPLHHDEEFAKNTRFGQLVAPGVMTFMSVWAKVVESDFWGDEMIAGKSTKIEWFHPVFAGDVLTGKGRVTRIERRNQYNGIAELSLEVFNQNGELVLTDVTEFIVKCRQE